MKKRATPKDKPAKPVVAKSTAGKVSGKAAPAKKTAGRIAPKPFSGVKGLQKQAIVEALASQLLKASKAIVQTLAVAGRKSDVRSLVVGPLDMARFGKDARLVLNLDYRILPSGKVSLEDSESLRPSVQVLEGDDWSDLPAQVTSYLADTAASSPVFAMSDVDSGVEAESDDTRESMPLPAVAKLCTRIGTSAPATIEQLVTSDVAVAASMDPRLQLVMLNRRSGKHSAATSSTGEGEVAVIAKVTDADAWIETDDVFTGADLGPAPDGAHIVTARIPIRRIAEIRRLPFVQSLKASYPVRGQLRATLSAMDASSRALGPRDPDGGAGVVIGIVDFGGDFAHRNFRHVDGTTRLLALWDQSGESNADSPFGYGRVFWPDQIDAALSTPHPHSALGYRPEALAHGTHVMDIAGGNGEGTGLPGLAPKADLIFVEAAASDVEWEGPDGVGQHFGDSVQILEAVRWIFDQAGDRPCVVNLSLGTNGGPHDGTSLVEIGLDAMLGEAPNRAIVVSAGNAQEDGVHAMDTIPAEGQYDLHWRVDLPGECELELWYPGAERLTASLIAPNGQELLQVAPGDSRSLTTPGGKPAVFAANRLHDPNNGDNLIGIWLSGGLPAGQWTLRLTSSSTRTVAFHAWIERNDEAQASFVNPTVSHLLGSISTGRNTLVVGSFDAHKKALPISRFSGSGPTRDGREKPELSAPGHNVSAARSRTRTGLTRMSGTSMAAPAVSGLAALVLAKAARVGQSLSAAELGRQVLANLAKHPQVAANAWHPQFGAGLASGDAV